MNKTNMNRNQSITRLTVIFFSRLLSHKKYLHLLLPVLMSFSSVSSAAAGAGVQLLEDLAGTFGDATEKVKTNVTQRFEDSGLIAAATEAKTALTDLAEGAVPVIDQLSNPLQDNAEEAIAKALEKVQVATNVLNKIDPELAQQAIKYIQESPLFADADFGITLPTGRIRVYRTGLEVSLCLTTVGPAGSVIISGISNSEQLCQFNDTRMHNPTKSLLAFTYIAAGRTHIRTNLILLPNLEEDLTLLPAPINAETYIQTVGDQWVQIRLAGADPKSIELEAKFEVGVKANVSYYVDVEAEGEAALKFSLKPIYAAEVIRSTGEVMLNRANALGLNMELGNITSDTADILKAGLQHLSDIESDYGDGFGNVSIDVKLTGGLGVGFLDTAISAVSANSTFNLTAPLTSFIEMRAGLLEEFLDAGMGMATVNLDLGTAILEGDKNALTDFRSGVQQASSDFVTGALNELLLLTTKIESIESTFTLATFGDADKQSVVIYESGLKLPISLLSDNLQNKPNVFGDSFAAVSYLMLSALDPTVEITPDVWTDLEGLVVPGIEFTLRARNPITLSLFGFKEADLLATLKSIATIREILINLVNSSLSESLADVRGAIENTLTVANANDAVVNWVNDAYIEKSIPFGTNASLGAEAVAELGLQVELEGGVSGSLFLLLINSPDYVAPEDNLLAKASIPIEFSLDVGASAGEGVELTVDAGGEIAFNAFELTAKHWDGDLPASALMEVAGFSVLEFNGVTRKDESFTGSGFLMLPIGGIVSADFEVDDNGSVVTGNWEGGLDLGPLGKFTFLEGVLDNDGIHGSVNANLFGSEVSTSFTLNSSGMLFGSYDGSLTIAGQQLAAVSVSLDANGNFIGEYAGNLDIGGFTADTDLTINNDGFTGSGSLDILGSNLEATNLSISNGQVSGTFTGSIQAGVHTLSDVSLTAANGGLFGTANMNLPGVGNVEVDLTIFDGRVRASYDGDFLGGLSSQVNMEITATGIMLSAALGDSLLTETSSEVIDLLITAAHLAEPLIGPAQTAVDAADDVVQLAFAALAPANIATAKQLIIDSYNLLKAPFLITFNLHDAAVTKLKSDIKYYNTKLRENQIAYDNGDIYWIKYNADKLFYEGLRATAQTSLNLIEPAYNFAVSSLAALDSELTKKLNDLEGILIEEYNDALAFWNKKLKYLNNLLTTISVLNVDAASLLRIKSIGFTADLSTLDLGGNITVSSRMMFMAYSGQVSLSLNLNDPVASIHQLVTDLLFAKVQLNTDAIAPTIVSFSPENWQPGNTLIQLVASDNSAVDSITYSATGAQTIATKTVPGNTTTVLINVEGMTTLSFYATDTNGNVSASTTISTRIDSAAPQISLITPADTKANPYAIEISAEDVQGSGIAYLLVSAYGAETVTEHKVLFDSTVVTLTEPGITTLTVIAVDMAGNSSRLTQDISLAELPEIIPDPLPGTADTSSTNSSDSESTSTGSGGLLLLLLLTATLQLRRFGFIA